MRNILNIVFASLYENIPGGFMDDFSEILYENYAYFNAGVFSIISSLIVVILFYYLINHPKFNRFYHWLFFLLLNLVVNFINGIYLSKSIFEELGIIMNYDSRYFFGFAVINAIWSAIFFFVFSIAFKWLSRNCARTPF